MCDTLAETIRDGIRYSLHYDDWDTETLLRDYEDCIPDALAVQLWSRWAWHDVWSRDGVAVIGDWYNDEDERAANLALGIHLHYATGYCQGDVIRIAHNGTLSQFSADLIRSLVFDGVAYATAERWTAEGFVVIDSISGISLMDGPEQTLEYAIDEFLACDEFLS